MSIYTLPQANMSSERQQWKIVEDEIYFWGPRPVFRHELLVSRRVYKCAILNYTSCPSCGRASASCDESCVFLKGCLQGNVKLHAYLPNHTTTQMEHWGITGILYSIRGVDAFWKKMFGAGDWFKRLSGWCIWKKGTLGHLWQTFATPFLTVEQIGDASLLGCPRKLGSMVKINGLVHLLINGIYWDYSTFTNLWS